LISWCGNIISLTTTLLASANAQKETSDLGCCARDHVGGSRSRPVFMEVKEERELVLLPNRIFWSVFLDIFYTIIITFGYWVILPPVTFISNFYFSYSLNKWCVLTIIYFRYISCLINLKKRKLLINVTGWSICDVWIYLDVGYYDVWSFVLYFVFLFFERCYI